MSGPSVHSRHGPAGGAGSAGGGAAGRLSHGSSLGGVPTAPYVGSKDNHAGPAMPPAAPYYGSQADKEMLAVVDVPAGFVTTGVIDPTAIIRNLVNTPATVTINSDGITIKDGVLTLEDFTGVSVLGPAGFAGQWVTFLASGLYNATYAGGSTDFVPIGTHTPTNQYVPYWTVSVTNAAAIRRQADASAPSGFALEFNSVSGSISGSGITNFHRQDVPVLPKQSFVMSVQARHVDAPGNALLGLQVTWLTAAGASIGSPAVSGHALTSTNDSYYMDEALIAPSNAAFARVYAYGYFAAQIAGDKVLVSAVFFDSNSAVVNTLEIISESGVVPAIRIGDAYDSVTYALTVNHEGTFEWSDGPGTNLASLSFDQSSFDLELIGSANGDILLIAQTGNVVRIAGTEATPDGTATLRFASDVDLKWGAANRLDLASGDTLRIATDGSTGALQFGAGGDVALYRSAANTLALAAGDKLHLLGTAEIDGSLTVDSSIYLPILSSLIFNNTENTTIHRLGTALLGVGIGGSFLVDDKLWIGDGAGGSDTVSLERTSSGVLSLAFALLLRSGETWTGISYINSWTNYGSPFQVGEYRKDALGFVHLRGLLNNAFTVEGAVLGTLPTGFRPSSTEVFMTMMDNVTSRVDVHSNGDIQMVSGSSPGWLTLSGITFRAA